MLAGKLCMQRICKVVQSLCRIVQVLCTFVQNYAGSVKDSQRHACQTIARLEY